MKLSMSTSIMLSTVGACHVFKFHDVRSTSVGEGNKTFLIRVGVKTSP